MVTLLGCLGLARAAEASFTITFKANSDDGSGALNAQTLAAEIESGSDYIKATPTVSGLFPGKNGLKFGSKNSTGNLSLNFIQSYKITSIVVNALSSKSGPSLQVQIDGQTAAKQSVSTTAKDYTFSGNGNAADCIYVTNCEKNKVLYVKSITVYYESDGPVVEKSAKPKIDGETSFTDNTQVTITAADGASIYYTVNGDDPTTSSTAYNAPFTISETTTVKAIAQEEGKDPSSIATTTFTKKNASDYVLVTSTDELDETSSYIIGIATNNKAMSNASSNSNIAQVDATIANSNLTPNDDVMTFKLVKDGNNWKFEAENYKGTNKYIAGAGSNTNCRMGSTAGSFTITFDGSHNAQLKSGSRYILGNGTSDFRNYTSLNQSGAVKVQLYRNGTEKVQTPEISLSSDKVKVGEKVTVTIDKKNAEKVYYTTDGTTPSATNGTEYTAPFEVTAEAVGEIKVTAVGVSEGKGNSSPAIATISVSKSIPAMPEGKWRLVRKAEELTEGKYIIGVASNNRAMTNAATTDNFIYSVPATIKDGILTPDATQAPMVFDLTGSEGAYTMAAYNYVGAGSYLAPDASSTTVKIAPETANLAITITQQKKAQISLATATERWIQYNTKYSDFLNYKGYGGIQVELYQLYDPSTVTACTTPVINVAKSELTAGESTSFTIDYEPGQQVRYTLDGSEPSATNGTVYNWDETVALNNLSATTIIKAIAYGEGMTASDVATATVTVKQITAAPVIAPESQEFVGSLAVSITASEGDIYYTLDASTPTASSSKYTEALNLTATMTVKAIAIAEGKAASSVVSATFTRIVPGMPVVTWTKDGVSYTAENNGEYEVYAGTRLNIVAVNGDSIKVTNLETEKSATRPSPSYLTVNKDIMASFASVNGDEVGDELTAMFTVVEKPAEKTYSLITSASQLKAGNKYVIAYKGETENVAVSNNGHFEARKNQYRQVIRDGFYIDADNVLHDRTFGTSTGTDGTEGVMVFTLGGQAGAWTLTADNFIQPADGVQNATEPAPGDKVKLHTFSEGYNFSMTTEHSPLKISFEGNNAIITSTGVQNQGNNGDTNYVVKYTRNNGIGLAKEANDSPLVQLYGYAPVAKPEAVVVTYTKVKEGEDIATEDCGEYTAINESKITVSSKNATQIEVNGTKHDAVNGVYSFTTDVDVDLTIKAVNEGGETDSYMVAVYVDYETDALRQVQILSRKQKDRNEKTVNAPVKFTGSAFVRGHYMVGELYEMVWVEDGNGVGSVLFDSEGELQNVPFEIDNGVLVKNFKVRAATIPTASYSACEIVSWPENVETEVGSYNFAEFVQGLKNASYISSGNEYKLQKFCGDITFTEEEATMKLSDDETITVMNQLSFKTTGDKKNFGRTDANGSFNWLAGQPWLNGQTKSNVYLLGYVMPKTSGNITSYVVYPAQITDNAGNITGVDGVENDGDGVYVQGGVIYAPAGSRVFGLNGAQLKAGQELKGGVYVVVTPDGQAVKVLVK